MKKQALFLAVTLGLTAIAGMSVQASPAQAAEAGDKTYLVVFKQDSGLPASYNSVISGAGGTVKRALPELGAVEVVSNQTDFLSKVQASSLVQDANVENIVYPEQGVDGLEADNPFAAISPTSSHDLHNQYQWDIKQVTSNGAAWSLPGGTGKSVDGKDIVVGVIDTGIDFNHPDLKDNYAYGKSFVPGISSPMDENGHGTHVAGSIAANGRVLGVGPDLKVAAYRVFGPTGGAATADIAAALRTAADDNVDVVNMSLGGYDWFQDPEYTTKDVVADVRLFNRAIQYAIKKGVTVVGSSGNNGMNITSPGQLTGDVAGDGAHGATHRSPSSHGLIRVASNGLEQNLAYYSNYGVGMIDVTAPGGDYGTAWLPTRDRNLRDLNLRCYSTIPGGYGWMIGTSMASPKTAALAGLVIANHGKDVLSPSQVKHIIQSSATDVNKTGYDAESGFGLINAVNALQ